MWDGIGRRLNDLPSALSAKVAARPAVERWREGRHDKRLALYRSRLIPREACAIAEELEQTGIVRFPFGSLDLPGMENLLSSAQNVMERNRETVVGAAARRDYLVLPTEELMRHPQIYQFGLLEPVIDIIESYIGQPAAYDGVVIQYTPADGREAATRVWHRDREDRRVIKFGIYLNDVDEDGGPFELFHDVRSKYSGARYTNAFLLDQADTIALAKDDLGGAVVRCTGAAGTALLADTARFFHRGRPATKRDRWAIFFSYFAARPKRPFYCDRSGMTRAQVRKLVEDLTPRQRDTALWRERLPLYWRLIPSARV